MFKRLLGTLHGQKRRSHEVRTENDTTIIGRAIGSFDEYERTGRIVVLCAIDNLGKGAAGQMIQCANLMLGLDETLGLTTIGVYP